MKRVMIFAVVLAGAGTMSCSRSDLQTPAPGEPNALRVEVSLNAEALNGLGNGFVATRSTRAAGAADGEGLVVNFGASDPEATTKSTAELATADDAKVHNLWAIQYKADGTLLGSPYYTTDIPTPGAGSTGIDATYSLAVNLTSNTETGGKVYFIANTNSPNTFNATNAATEAKLKEVVKNIGTELKPTASGGIPMLGIYTGAVQSSATLSAVPMKRLAAKVILKYKVNPAFAGFTITGIQLRNVAADMHLGAEPTGIFPAAADDSHIDYPAEDLTTATTEGDYQKFVWYVPENHRDVISSVLDAGDRSLDRTDGKATYIEIHGRQTAATQSKKITYRILLGDPTTDPGDFNVRRNTSYLVEVDINGANPGDNRITVESFDMNNCAILWPGATAGSVTFDVRKCLANTFTTEQQLTSMLNSGAWRVEVRWQDAAAADYDAGVKDYVTISYNEPGQADDKTLGLFTVTANTKTPGNAVVALLDNATSDGTVLWSWHIWVTGYLPDGTKDYGLGINSKATVAGGEVHTYGENYKKASDRMGGGPLRVIMDRNLGATGVLYALPTIYSQTYPTYGLFYQWGRKDPFIGAAEGVMGDNVQSKKTYYWDGQTTAGLPVVTNGPKTLAESVQNPDVFVCVTSDPYDWNSSPDDNLWGDGAVKSPYDPCPKGWRVVPKGTWDDFGASLGTPFGKDPNWTGADPNIAGGLYSAGSVKAFYPAPGYRISHFGSLQAVASYGCCWTSKNTDDGRRGYFLDFDDKLVKPNNANYRAFGFPVRCMQE